MRSAKEGWEKFIYNASKWGQNLKLIVIEDTFVKYQKQPTPFFTVLRQIYCKANIYRVNGIDVFILPSDAHLSVIRHLSGGLKNFE